MSDTEARHCPECDAEIPAAAPGGMCPKCMLGDAIPAPVPSTDDDATVAMDSPPELSPEAKAARERLTDSPSPPDPKKGAQQFAPPIEDLADLFPDLEILELLGAGGMGAVYKARQPRLDRLVALKILSCPHEYHENFALRFEREAQLLAKLNHPNIVTLYDFGELDRSDDDASENNLYYFVMEYVDGADLSRLIHDGGLEPEQALRLVPQICDALQFAHDEGITHRDIKPANILVDKRGKVRIADFGLGKLIATEQEEAMMTGLTMTGTSMGTPHYMAPEQWDAPEKVDHRADIYSLGVVFYEMLTGSRPHGVFTPPSEQTKVDDRIDTVVLKAMEKEPDLRYQQAREVKEDVTRVTTTTSRGNPIKPKGNKTETTKSASGSKHHSFFVSALAIILLSGIGFLFSPLNPWSKDARGTGDIAFKGGAGANSESLPAIPSQPGPLRAEGSLRWGGPIQVDSVPDNDHFVQVLLNSNLWAALRSNGQVVTNQKGVVVENVARLLRSDFFSFGTIDQNGRLAIHGDVPDIVGYKGGSFQGVSVIPEEIQEIGVEDAQWAAGIAIARLRDGSARVWGERYEGEFNGEAQWALPPEEALRNVVDIAICRYGCATLTEDGQFHLWGQQFSLSEIPVPDGEVVKIESQHTSIRALLSDGRVHEFACRIFEIHKDYTGGGIGRELEDIDRALVLRKGSDQWESIVGSVKARLHENKKLVQLGRRDPQTFSLFASDGEVLDGEFQVNAIWIEPVTE